MLCTKKINFQTKLQYSENIICKLFEKKYQRRIGDCLWTDELCCLVKIFIFCCISLFYVHYHLVNKARQQQTHRTKTGNITKDYITLLLRSTFWRCAALAHKQKHLLWYLLFCFCEFAAVVLKRRCKLLRFFTLMTYVIAYTTLSVSCCVGEEERSRLTWQ